MQKKLILASKQEKGDIAEAYEKITKQTGISDIQVIVDFFIQHKGNYASVIGQVDSETARIKHA